MTLIRPFAQSLSRRIAALVLAAVLAGVAAAAPVKTEHVEAELVAEGDALVPGRPATLALRLKIQDGWHTYWRNAGDSGLATTLAWRLPPGFAASDIDWPAPRALPAGPLVNYGYEGEVHHLVTITPPKDLKPGSPVTLPARADWLVCRETCIPDGADLTITLPVAERAAADPRHGTAIAATRAALPQPLAGWTVKAAGEGPTIRLTLAPPAGAPDAGTLRFFPYGSDRLEPSGAQPQSRGPAGEYVLALPVSSQLAEGVTRLDGVITATGSLGNAALPPKAGTIDVALEGAIVAGPKPKLDAGPQLSFAAPADSGMTLAAAALFAFVGGLILNLMPCVFPVISLKALSLALPGHGSARVLRTQGLAFAVGVIAAFVGLALLLLALRAAGEQLGWGFQLQSPAVVTGLALLFFVLALNLSGVFEFGTLLPGAANWSAKNPYVDAVLSGILAVAIASPCTAPFMGAALGFALAQTAAATVAVFVALGAGMALPYLLLCVFPGWRRKLPRPGAWMERLKQFLAFPLYGTVAWLAWVLGAQVDNDAVMRLLVTLVALAFALWAWRAYRGGAARAFSVVALAGLAGAAYVAWPLFAGEPGARAAATAGEDAWQPYSAARVAELAQAGRPVFVDFTAAWCVTCQVNKKLVLNRAAMREEFARRNVALLRADWTRRDPAITQALAALGRQGVPVYVLFRPGREPLLLPEVLKQQTVSDALATL